VSWLEALGIFRRAPDPRTAGEIEAEVQAEIEHHLACRQRELVEQGETPERARVEALKGFGDVVSAREACLRIQMGERIMLQRIHFVVTVLLLVAVLGLAWAGQQSAREAARATEMAMAARAEALERMEAASRARQRVEHIVIEVGDELQLVDAYNPDLCCKVTVAADGKILVPEVGWVAVAGLTREDAEKTLTEVLSRYYVECDVKVVVQPEQIHALPVSGRSTDVDLDTH
jgi:hypothetical protein